MESTAFKNLRKCFQEVFGLDISFNGSFFQAYIDSSSKIPIILAQTSAGSKISISGLPSYGVLRMRKSGSNNIGMQERIADENGVVVLTGGTGGSQGGSEIYYHFGEIGIRMSEKTCFMQELD